MQAAKAGHRAPIRAAYRAATKDATLQVPERAAAQEALAKISSTPEEAANYSHTLDVAVRDKVKGLRGPKRQEAIAKEYRAWTEAAKPVKWETESVPGVGRVPIAKAATAAVEEAPSPGVIHMPRQPCSAGARRGCLDLRGQAADPAGDRGDLRELEGGARHA